MFKSIKNLKNNNPAGYLGIQITFTLLLVAMIVLTATSFISPDRLTESLGEDVRGLASEYIVFRPDEDPELEKKKLSIYIDTQDENTYKLTDSSDKDYYFEINPFVDDGFSTEISHQIANKILEVDFDSFSSNNENIMDQLIMETSLSIGSPEIPLDIDLEVKNNSPIEIDISEHKVEKFEGTFASKNTTLSFSDTSTPKDFKLNAQEGLTKINTPRDTKFSLDYAVSPNAKLFINNEEINGEDTYTQ